MVAVHPLHLPYTSIIATDLYSTAVTLPHPPCFLPSRLPPWPTTLMLIPLGLWHTTLQSSPISRSGVFFISDSTSEKTPYFYWMEDRSTYQEHVNTSKHMALTHSTFAPTQAHSPFDNSTLMARGSFRTDTYKG